MISIIQFNLAQKHFFFCFPLVQFAFCWFCELNHHLIMGQVRAISGITEKTEINVKPGK